MAMAACSLVPQPTMVTGPVAWPSSRSRMAAAIDRRGREHVARREQVAGKAWLGRDHLFHDPRRAGSQFGEVAHPS